MRCAPRNKVSLCVWLIHYLFSLTRSSTPSTDILVRSEAFIYETMTVLAVLFCSRQAGIRREVYHRDRCKAEEGNTALYEAITRHRTRRRGDIMEAT
ncbi:hypothetical protein GGS21DRAFT_531576 [Xylaria nigripes]|nr:hypothetical protein GGS21DRAFT_531576 [Xylaria nigripes]